MSYRNKTYVVFDGDDINHYWLMKAWCKNENIDFDFHDAHEVRGIRSDSEEESVKRGLRERFKNAKQVIILVGQQTRYLTKYVRWEIDVAQELELPIIVANLNSRRNYDDNLCPPIMDNYYAVHVSFQPKIIQYALDQFPSEFHLKKNDINVGKHRIYNESIYKQLGL